MVPLLFATYLAAANAACPDPALANPRLKVVRADVRGFDDYIVTLDVTNRGQAAQNSGVDQRLDLLQRGTVLGTQPIPALGPNQTYVTAFRIRVPHDRKRKPLDAEFRYVLANARDLPRQNCTADNDVLSAKL